MKPPKFLLRITYLLIILYLSATTGNSLIVAIQTKLANPRITFASDFYLHLAGWCVVIVLFSFLFRRLGPQDSSPHWK